MILILEIKRMAGILKFDPEFNQFTRITEEKVAEPYSDPIVQAERQKFQLEKWLRQNTVISNIPIETLVVSTSNKATLQTSHGDVTVREKVIHKEYLPFKIDKCESKYLENLLNSSQLRSLSDLLLRSHTPLNPDILQKYGISKSELLTGVRCPECKYLPMKRKKGRWICPRCRFVSKTAHLKALEDYTLLIDNKITNEEARQFLQLESSSVAKRLLSAACTAYEGDRKARIYFIGTVNKVTLPQ